MRETGRGKDRALWIVGSVAVAAVVLKFFVSFHVYGTNDIASWYSFSREIARVGPFEIYRVTPYFNHPPPISFYLFPLSGTGSKFPFLFRILPILSDLGSVILIYLLTAGAPVRRRIWIGVLAALSPVHFLISAFHGNTDPVFMFFVLWAVYAAKRGFPGRASLALGFGSLVKIVPLVLWPLFFFRFKLLRERLLFAGGVLAVFLGILAPFFLAAPRHLFGNVFLYGSSLGCWGLSCIMVDAVTSVSNGIPAVLPLWASAIESVSMISILLFVFFFPLVSKARGISLESGVCFIFLFILSFTPGFGIQYLVWLAYPLLLVWPLMGALYGLLGGVTLWCVYRAWGASSPPFLANSWDVPFLSLPSDVRLLLHVLWFFILLVLVFLMRGLQRGRLTPGLGQETVLGLDLS